MTESQLLKLKELETKAESNINYHNEKKESYREMGINYMKDNKVTEHSGDFQLSIIKDLFLKYVKNYEIAEAELKTIKTIKELLEI